MVKKDSVDSLTESCNEVMFRVLEQIRTNMTKIE